MIIAVSMQKGGVGDMIMLAYTTRLGTAHYVGGTRPAEYALGTQRLTHQEVLDMIARQPGKDLKHIYRR